MFNNIEIKKLKINENNAKIEFIMEKVNYELSIEKKDDNINPYSITHPIGSGNINICTFCETPYQGSCSYLNKKMNELFLDVKKELIKSEASRLRWLTFAGKI